MCVCVRFIVMMKVWAVLQRRTQGLWGAACKFTTQMCIYKIYAYIICICLLYFIYIYIYIYIYV